MAKVLMLGQQTEMAHLLVQGAGEIRASAPKFNLRGVEKWNDGSVKNYDASVFGVRIAEAVHQLLQTPGIVALAQEMSVKLPEYQFDTFCQSKANKILPLVDECRKRGLNVDKLEAYIKAVQKLDKSSITSLADWDAFLKEQGIPADWSSRLHYDHVLGLLVDVDERTAKEIRKTPAPCKAGDRPEDLERFSFRWLSKCLNLWTLKGCLTDVVNTICAMLGADDPHQLNEAQLVTLVSKFASSLKEIGGSHDLSWLWLPDIVLMDAEGDDCVAWVLCQYLCGLAGKKLRTHVQLPYDGECQVEKDGKREMRPTSYTQLSFALGKHPGTIVFRDQDSKNGSALASFHGL